MKVCELCGTEISTRDGENRCTACEDNPEMRGRGDTSADAKAKRQRRNANRRARDEVMRSLGLVKVRGAMGGTYWE